MVFLRKTAAGAAVKAEDVRSQITLDTLLLAEAVASEGVKAQAKEAAGGKAVDGETDVTALVLQAGPGSLLGSAASNDARAEVSKRASDGTSGGAKASSESALLPATFALDVFQDGAEAPSITANVHTDSAHFEKGKKIKDDWGGTPEEGKGLRVIVEIALVKGGRGR